MPPKVPRRVGVLICVIRRRPAANERAGDVRARRRQGAGRPDARRAPRRRNAVRSCTAASPAQRRDRDTQRPVLWDGETEREGPEGRGSPADHRRITGESPAGFSCSWPVCVACVEVSGPLSRDVVQPPSPPVQPAPGFLRIYHRFI